MSSVMGITPLSSLFEKLFSVRCTLNIPALNKNPKDWGLRLLNYTKKPPLGCIAARAGGA
jgi:hypothetical protein